MLKNIVAHKKNQSGQTLAEYILLIAWVVIGVAGLYIGFKEAVSENYNLISFLVSLPAP